MSSHHLQIRQGAPVTIRSNAVMTSGYVATTAVDLKSYDSVSVMLTINTVGAETVSVKSQWSNDNVEQGETQTTWYDELEDGEATISGTESTRGSYTAVFQFSANTGAPNPIRRYRRLGRHFRLAIKSSGTTAKISVTAMPMNNEN